MTDTPSAPGAQAPSTTHRRRFHFEPRPIDPALRRRRIKIARAFNLICRSKCSVSVALRACGLDHDHNAREDVADLLDRKGISRIRKGVRRVRFKETPSRVFEEFIPRQEKDVGATDTFVPRHDLTKNPNLGDLPPSRRDLAAMVAELREIADPLGPSDANVSLEIKEINSAHAPKPPVICACTVCGRSFESKQRRARYCGGRCRIKHWRARQ
jgi:hypothetical protein